MRIKVWPSARRLQVVARNWQPAGRQVRRLV